MLGLNSSAIYAGAVIGGVVGGLVLPAGAAFDDTALDRWIGQARSYVAGLPQK